MLIESQGNSVDIPKSTGRLVAFLAGSGLPVLRFSRGSRVQYTSRVFGPRPETVVCDWDHKSPMKFNQREVDKALATGLVVRVGDEILLSEQGAFFAKACENIWGFEIDDYFKGYNVDWRTIRD